MKLPLDATIAPAKITKYLLQWKPQDDKSLFLAQAGYGLDNWEQLLLDLREQILPLEATPTEKARFGDVYEIRGMLAGPNGISLAVVTIWMKEYTSGITKFITLFPNKETQ